MQQRHHSLRCPLVRPVDYCTTQCTKHIAAGKQGNSAGACSALRYPCLLDALQNALQAKERGHSALRKLGCLLLRVLQIRNNRSVKVAAYAERRWARVRGRQHAVLCCSCSCKAPGSQAPKHSGWLKQAVNRDIPSYYDRNDLLSAMQRQNGDRVKALYISCLTTSISSHSPAHCNSRRISAVITMSNIRAAFRQPVGARFASQRRQCQQ